MQKAHRKRTSTNATQNKIVFHIRLHHPKTINNVSLNSVSRIRQTDVQPVLHLEVDVSG